jgi:hypothetical protein
MSDTRARFSVWGACVVLLALLAAIPLPAHAAGTGEIYAPLSDVELDSLVAPIALYPDSLLAQILGAATYPDQVVAANQYVKVNAGLTGAALQQAIEGRGWDPAVQALAQFPTVLKQLAENISWTSALGDATANQQADVMAAVQRLRARAYAAGNLKSGDQITVVQQSPQVIVIEPVQPSVIYVPAYNPTVIYGAPLVVPNYYYPPPVVTAAAITFGVGVAIAASSGSSCAWGVSWGTHGSSASIRCGSAPYYGNPYWRGGYYPGYHPGYRPPYYYPPPRPPYPPPGGGPPRPVQPIAPPSHGPGGSPPGRPGSPSTLPAPPPAGPGTRPARPGTPPPNGTNTRPATPGNLPANGPTTRPGGSAPGQQPADRALRGYGGASTQPARNPNAFAGSGGGRAQSARGNQSLSGPRPAAGGRRQ